MTTPLKQTLIADLDGTVVKCGRYYNDANTKIAAKLATDHGIPADLIHELIDYVDVWAIRAQPNSGFLRTRYPRAAAMALAAVQGVMTDFVNPADVNWAHRTADAVFSAPYEPFDGAVETLKAYRDAGWQVILLTKGDPSVQQSKIDKNNLRAVLDGVVIVPAKNVETLQAVLERYHVDTLTSVYVGDSVRDDMTPANALGVYAVRVETPPEDHWRHDAITDLVSDMIIPTLRDLPSVVPLDGSAIHARAGIAVDS